MNMAASISFYHLCLRILSYLVLICFVFSTEVFSNSEHEKLLTSHRQKVLKMFYHAYDGYMLNAYPYDELRPLTCDGHDTWGSFSLTLIDALDTLAIIGNSSEFRRVMNLILTNSDFDKDINVSIFETNIRVVGGLLSAHLLSYKMGVATLPGWPCSGPLLDLAESVARRLLPAFETPTGIPYGTVNLRHGIPPAETPVACTACAVTNILEFSVLTRLTGDPIFEITANRALDAIWMRRSKINLVGNHINVITGEWTAVDSGIGGGIDSYFEYLVKAAMMFKRTDLLKQFRVYEDAINKYAKLNDWYMMVNMKQGGVTMPLFQSLEAFWPGLQSLLGDVEPALKTLHNYHQIWQQFGFTPEMYNIPKTATHPGRGGYPLRPELIESVMYLYRTTRDPYLLKIGVDIVSSISKLTRTPCGFATIKNVNTHRLDNRMESFFLSETIKYLYLLFTPDHFIHNPGNSGVVITTPQGECIIDSGGYVFNTEAHPFDIGAVHCCSTEKKRDESALWDLHDNLDVLALFGITEVLPTGNVNRWSGTVGYFHDNLYDKTITDYTTTMVNSILKSGNANGVKNNRTENSVEKQSPQELPEIPKNTDYRTDNVEDYVDDRMEVISDNKENLNNDERENPNMANDALVNRNQEISLNYASGGDTGTPSVQRKVRSSSTDHTQTSSFVEKKQKVGTSEPLHTTYPPSETRQTDHVVDPPTEEGRSKQPPTSLHTADPVAHHVTDNPTEVGTSKHLPTSPPMTDPAADNIADAPPEVDTSKPLPASLSTTDPIADVPTRIDSQLSQSESPPTNTTLVKQMLQFIQTSLVKKLNYKIKSAKSNKQLIDLITSMNKRHSKKTLTLQQLRSEFSTLRSYSVDSNLLSCKALPYYMKFTLMGEFYSNL